MESSIELEGGSRATNTWIDETENNRDSLCDQVEDFNRPSEASGVYIETVQADHCPYINSRALVSSLPNEILSTIFEAGHLSSPSGPSQQPFESLVSQVTTRWRRTALATPQLWTRLYIDFGHSSHSMTEAYLSRSGALPLDLHLTTRDASVSEFDETVHFSLIRRHANRWRRLRVDPAWQNVLNQLLDILPSTVPLLECVQICSEEVDQKDILARGIFEGGAPSLTAVGIRGIDLQCCLPPLATVTSLQLHSAALSQTLASTLNGLPALTFLVIDGAFSRWEHLRTTFSLPALEEFRLITWSAGDMPDLLKMISAPLLNSLLLENVVPSDIDDFLSSVGWTPGWVKYPRLRFLTVLTSEGSSFKPLEGRPRASKSNSCSKKVI